MYLKSLVLRGFKSFADKSTFALEPGITAIVGPNGSGKSNISDAVLWVLGELNARNLRGQAMEDVIFAGSSSRKPVNVAEVELVLDNSDHTLPVEFEEVSIGRRMYRNGESEYLINGVQARRMDVLEILHDSGLGTGTHSIISQGQLDSVLEAKPEDRRALIEEAAGVLKHKQRKQKSARKLERMDQHLTRVRDITAEVERQIKPLERKAKRAREYKELSDQLSQLTLSLAVDDLRTLQKKWGLVLEKEAEIKGQLSELDVQAYQSDSNVRELQRKLMEQAEGSSKTEGAFHNMRNSSERIEGTVRVLREKRRSLLRSREEKAMELDANKLRLTELETELAEAKASEAETNRAKGAAEAKYAKLRSESDDLKNRLSACEREMRQLERDQASLETRIQVLREKQLSMSQAYQEGLADKKLVEDKQAGLGERIAEAVKAAEALEAEVVQSNEALAEMESAEREARNATSESMAALEEARKASAKAQGVKASCDARVAALESAERARKAGNTARVWASKHESALPELVSVLDVPANLDGVVELLLGDAVDALLAENPTDAQAVMKGLQEQQLEGSVYLLEAGVSASVAQGVSGEKLMDLISFPEQWRGALSQLLGDVLVCDTYQDAIRLRDANPGATIRVASRDGFIVSSKGFQRFGRKADDFVGAVQQRQHLNNAKAEAKKAAEALKESNDAVVEAEKVMRQAQKASLDLTGQLATKRGENKALQARLKDQRNAVAQLQNEEKDLSRKLEQARATLDKLQPSRDMVEDDLTKCQENLASVKANVAQYREGVVPLRAQSQSAVEACTEAKLSFVTLKERCTYASRVTLARQQSLDAMNNRIQRTAQYLERSKQAPETIDELLVSFEKLQSSLMRNIGRLDAEITRVRGLSTEINTQVEEARKKSRGLHNRIDECNSAMSDVRVAKGRLEIQVEAATNAIVKDCGTPLEVALQVASLEDREQAQEQAEKLRRRIANMGTINPDAAAEYEELKVRYDFLQGQVDDMNTARRSLEKIVRIIDERMKKDFIDTFNQVNSNFQEIFVELFPGGTAELILVDETDPEHSGIDVIAQPVGKKVAKTSLMSGGEKSLIAMALLMAVYRTRSTPFYILDEVEAALDDTNLRRLCSCMDAMRAREQQLLVITHQRRTMEMADVLYGVSMQGGATKLVSQRLDRDKLRKGE